MKYDYYVQIMFSNGDIKYVTGVENTTKTFYYEEGKPALKMSKSAAEDLVFCLVANMYAASIIQSPKDCITYVNSTKNQEYKYMLLDRMLQDCKYFINYTHSLDSLWAKNITDHIDTMRSIYDELYEKPEWLSRKEIDEWEKELKKNIRINENILKALRAEYPEGAKIKLVRMDDKQAPPVGAEGIVKKVDDCGTVHVSWETGSSLGVLYGIDKIVKL